MNRKQLWTGLMVVLAASSVALAQYDDTYGDYENEDVRHGANDASYGLLFTPTMVDFAINRLTEEMGNHYDFDEDQLWMTRELIKERFPAWLDEHRDEIVVVMNQFLESTISDDPPTASQVADWAGRAMPLLNEFTGMIEGTAEDMRPILTDEQQVILDGEMAAFRVGTNYMQQRVTLWEQGGYDWETEWPRSESFRDAERERVEALELEQDDARSVAMGLEPSGHSNGDNAALAAHERTLERTARPTGNDAEKSDEWTIYVENFIKRYQLDEAQRNNARRFLRQAHENRDRYLGRKLDDINRISLMLKQAESEDEKTRIREKYEQLTAPLDRYFTVLKDKLDRLPTRAQRKAAAMAEIKQATPEKKLESLKKELAEESDGEG